MRLDELWRTTTFRLTLIYGVMFALGVVALLGMVYDQSAIHLTNRRDAIMATEAEALANTPPNELRRRIDEALALNGKSNVFALFSPGGAWITGNLRAIPAGLDTDGAPIEIAPTKTFPDNARVIARRLPTGDELIVGRDIDQLLEMRAITASALLWSGVWIIIVGLSCGVALSIRPLQRLHVLQAAAQEIAAGDLKRRMPTSNRHDELDMFAATVNYMMDEVERLMSEVKGATETIAHDLRTPLTRARARLERIQQTPDVDPEEIALVTAKIDEVLERFRAILRITELEVRERQGGFTETDLAEITRKVVELYQPLAESEGVRLSLAGGSSIPIAADPKLLFEAVSNLVDNAIKFSGAGGAVQVRLGGDPAQPQIIVQDDGPGIPESERSAVLQRFYRAERNRLVPGSGLGLSIVIAIVRLHRFELTLSDANPGLKAVIDCRAPALAY